MNKKYIIEKVAAGLRAIEKKPDAFIFILQDDWRWDEKTILGIPVFYTDFPFRFYDDQLTNPCPFIPVWSDEKGLTAFRFSCDFVKKYDEYHDETLEENLG